MKSVKRTVVFSGEAFGLVPLKAPWAKPRPVVGGGACVVTLNKRVKSKQVRTYFHGETMQGLEEFVKGPARKVSCRVEVAHNVYDSGIERVSLDYRMIETSKPTKKLRIVTDADALAQVPLALKSTATVISLPCGAGTLVVWDNI